jgi:uncharacterized protein (TIGR02271 family)
MYNDQNQGMTNDTMGQQFVEGTPVFDAGGEKVGTVSEHNVQGGYLVVHKGWLFPKDVYVPLNVIQSNNADGIYLSMYKDDLANQNWDNPPIGGSDVVGTANMNAVDTTATNYTQTAQANVTDTEDIRVPVMEEELVVGKQEQEIGRVHLHKDVVAEQETITEPVTREQVYVERVPVQGNATDVGVDAFTEKDIDVPVMGEELVAGKRAVVTEEVRLHKQDITEQEQVTDTVRKERVIVEGADDVRGADNVTTRDNIDRDDYTR